MSKKGQYWTWPEKTEELTYEREEVVKKTSANCMTVVTISDLVVSMHFSVVQSYLNIKHSKYNGF